MRIITFICATLLGMCGPALADADPPWGWPACKDRAFKPNYERDRKRLPQWPPPDSPFVTQPYAHDRAVYSGIYEAVEQRIAPMARHFWPQLKFEEHRDFVRVRRVTRDGKAPPKRVKANGALQTVYNASRISMRIDKCDGRISELRFEKDG